jgi:hypothetical protein
MTRRTNSQPAASGRGAPYSSPALAPPAPFLGHAQPSARTIWSEIGPKPLHVTRIVLFCRGFAVRMRGLEPGRSSLTHLDIHRPTVDKSPAQAGVFHMETPPSPDITGQPRTPGFGPDLVRDWSGRPPCTLCHASPEAAAAAVRAGLTPCSPNWRLRDECLCRQLNEERP